MAEITLDTYTTPLPAFRRSMGPKNAKIAIVGEALGEQEDLMGAPFVGASGQELTRMLKEGGISRGECFLTNVFPFRPKRNEIELLCVNKAGAGPQYPMPPLRMGKYFHPKLLGELTRLKEELQNVNPNLVIALGNTACWALLARTTISSIRGAVATSTLIPGLKTLPTYHPSAVLRNWALRPIAVADFLKGAREKEFPELVRPERFVLVNPTMGEISEWFKRPAEIYSVDIETAGGQITMVGFARTISDAIVVPFVDPSKPSGSYWETHQEELEAWGFIAKALSSPIPKLFQNGLYDMQYLLKMGFSPRNCLEDTMLLSHAMYPEMQKGLGFLGSVHTNESSWKLMTRHETFKKDE